MNTVRDNLIAARALIDTPEKWGQGEYESATGCLCALGAVARAVIPHIYFECDEPASFEEDRVLAMALPDGWEKKPSYVAEFNDADGTTHADILALFDRAIEAAS